MKKPTYHRGFTIVELMIALAIVSILVTAALPNMRSFILNNGMKADVSELISTLYFARAEAVKRRVTVMVCPTNTAGTDCKAAATYSDWGQGWVVKTVPGNEVIRAKKHRQSGITFASGSATSIQYQPNGSNSTTASVLNICAAETTQGKKIQVTGTGRPYTGTYTCSS